MFLLKQTIDHQVSDMKVLTGLEELDLPDQDEMKMVPLHYAAWYNNVGAVEKLIQYNADVMERDKDGSTPLHYAARYKQRQGNSNQDLLQPAKDTTAYSSIKLVIRKLVDAGADVNARDAYGTTPLFYAVLRNNIEATEELLDCFGIDVQSADQREMTALHIAARHGQGTECAELLIRNNAQIQATDDTGLTPMHLACIEGNVKIVRLLLNNMKGQEQEIVNALTQRRESPLDFAVENKFGRCVKICLEYGAKVQKTCRDVHLSPLHLCASVGGPKIATMLLEKDPSLVKWRSSDQATPLHKAAQTGRIRVAQILLDSGSDIEAKDINRMTPLLCAVANGSKKVMKLLVERGANLEARNKKDQNVLHLFAQHNRVEALRLALECLEEKNLLGKMINSDDRLGNTPLHVAAEEGYDTIAQILLAKDAELRLKNEDEENALHVAARMGRVNVVREILKDADDEELKGDTNIINDEEEDSNTPLHLAAENGHVQTMKLLMDAGAEIDHVNRKSWTPLISAASTGQIKCLEELIKANSDVNAKDRMKNTALHLACKEDHIKVVKLLLCHNAGVGALNIDGQNPLDLAITFGNREVAMALMESDQWKDALRNRTPGQMTGNDTTPMRKLIRKMPEVAEKVLDRCIDYPMDIDMKDVGLTLEFDFEFLDDTYTSAHWGDPELVDAFNSDERTYDENKYLLSNARPYTDDATLRQQNHPLNVMVSAQTTELLHHPLSLALMARKWRVAQVAYYSFLIFYAVFVAVLTAYMVLSLPPYQLNQTLLAQENVETCRNVVMSSQYFKHFVVEPGHPTVGSYLIWVLAALGLTVEIVQLYNQSYHYFAGFTNLLDWFTYSSACIMVIPIEPCGIKSHWQWQLGSVCMFVAWMNLILFLRRLPGIGIYIVMVGQVFITFVKFFAFSFSFFLLAFGFTFFALLRNQTQFERVPYAFVKMVVMMIGELDYVDMFHSEGEEMVHYEAVSYLLFLTFCCMVTIVITNLLTGLAVGDVQSVQQQALLKRMALQVELALDIETSMPDMLQRKLQCIIPRQTIRPNKNSKSLQNKVGRLLSGKEMSTKAIARAVYSEFEEEMEEKKSKRDKIKEQASHTQGMYNQIISQVHNNRSELQAVNAKLDKIESMMEAILNQTKPNLVPR